MMYPCQFRGPGRKPQAMGVFRGSFTRKFYSMVILKPTCNANLTPHFPAIDSILFESVTLTFFELVLTSTHQPDSCNGQSKEGQRGSGLAVGG